MQSILRSPADCTPPFVVGIQFQNNADNTITGVNAKVSKGYNNFAVSQKKKFSQLFGPTPAFFSRSLFGISTSGLLTRNVKVNFL